MTNNQKGEQALGRNDLGQVTKVARIIAPIECYIQYNLYSKTTQGK